MKIYSINISLQNQKDVLFIIRNKENLNNIFINSFMHSWKSNHILQLLLKSHKFYGQTKDKITKDIKSYFWEHDISHVPLILCKNKGILGRDIVCQRDCYFQIKLQFPHGAKNFMNSHQILHSILVWSPYFLKQITSLKIRGYYEFGIWNLWNDYWIHQMELSVTTNLQIFWDQ